MGSIPLTTSPAVAVAAPGALVSSPVHALTRAVVTALIVAALAMVAVLLLAARAEWWKAFAAASVCSVAAAAASVPVVALGLRHGPRRPELVMAACLSAMFTRAVISLGGVVAAVLLGGYPKAATLLMVVPYYFSILAAETFAVARLLQRLPSPEPQQAPATAKPSFASDAPALRAPTSTPAENNSHA
jgi:hypothetical protein